MKKLLIVGMFLMTSMLLLSSSSNAAIYQVDPIYSHIYFRVAHIMGHVGGMFVRFDGTVELDDQKQRLVFVEGDIDVSSLDTRSQLRDKDLRSARFFDVEKFPTAHFKSTKISKNSIAGELTLKGKTRKVNLDYEFGGVSTDQFNRKKVGLSMTTTVKRDDFDLNYNEKVDGKWLIGETVDLQIDLEGILQE